MLSLSGGKWKGRKFAQTIDTNVRPTAIRAREGLFNVLEHRFGNLHGHRIADLYAGTGALGLEALSRGADYCCFVEQDAKTAKNLKTLLMKLSANADVQSASAASLGASSKAFDLVFLDPPYGQNLIQASLESLRTKGWLKGDSLIVAELDTKDPAPEAEGYVLVQDRKWGRNRFLFYTLSGEGQNPV